MHTIALTVLKIYPSVQKALRALIVSYLVTIIIFSQSFIHIQVLFYPGEGLSLNQFQLFTPYSKESLLHLSECTECLNTPWRNDGRINQKPQIPFRTLGWV